MSQQSAKRTPPSRRILWVLADEQRDQYRSEIEAMRKPGLEFVFDDEGDEALEKLTTLQPALVVVGSMVGSMEGLEFLALVMKRHSDFAGKVIVLPDPDDGLQPMCHYKDAATGRSVTEAVSLDRLAQMVGELASSPAASSGPRPRAPTLVAAGSPPPAVPPPAAKKAPSAPPKLSPLAGKGTPSASPPRAADSGPAPKREGSGDALPRFAAPAVPATVPASHSGPLGAAVSQSRRSAAPDRRPPLLWILGGLAAAILVGVVLTWLASAGDDEAEAEGKETPASEETAKASKTSAAPDPAKKDGGDKGSPAEEPAKAPPAAEPTQEAEASAEGDEAEDIAVEEEGESPDGEPPPATPSGDSDIDTSKPVALPLAFSQGRSGYRISDPQQMTRILRAFTAVLEANPNAKVEVGGHTSGEGHISINRAIGERRAESVRRDLISRGIPEDRILTKSYGESKARRRGRKNRRGNRRVTIRIVE